MSIFKDSFPLPVKKQIDFRQSLIGRDSNRGSLIHTLSSRTPFVRMSSSVNVSGSNELAKNNILFGGTSVDKKGISEGFGNARGTYRKSTGPYSQGFRPMPGIDNISVSHKGAYGSLREVTVNFKCWDIHQLEELELLYMRPGFTLLVEWGWTNYIKSDGHVYTIFTDQQVNGFYDIINSTATKTISEVVSDLRGKSLASEGNYDAMFGKIKNYSWSARPDGGYDCVTTIISMGEVIESLKVNNIVVGLDAGAIPATGHLISGGVINGNAIGVKSSYGKSYIGGLFHELYEALVISRRNGANNVITYNKNVFDGTFTLFSASSKFFPGIIKEDNKQGNNIISEDLQAFISLGSLVDLLNSVIKKLNGLVELKVEGYYATVHPLQISVDPNICLISSPLWERGINTKKLNEEVKKQQDDYKANEKATLKSFLLLDANGNVDEAEVTAATSILNAVFTHIFTTFDPSIATTITQPILDYVSKRSDKEQARRALNTLEYAFESNVRGVALSIPEYQKIILGTKDYDKELSSGAVNSFLTSNPSVKFYTYGKYNPAFRKGANHWYNLVDQLSAAFDSDYQSEDMIFNYAVDSNINKALQTSSNFNFIETIDAMYFSATRPLIKFQNSLSFVIKNAYKLPQNDVDLMISNIEKNITALDDFDQAASDTNIDTSTNLNDKLAYLKALQPYFVKDANGQYVGEMKNIYINLNYLWKQALVDLGNNDRQEKNNLDLYSFIKSILKDVQACIGNVNNFEVQVDENIANIIDINFTGDPAKAKETKIEIQNKKSFAKKYSLQSQIFPEQSTMISIAAQKSPDQLNEDTSTLKAYAKNLEDRVLAKIQDNTPPIVNTVNLDKYTLISNSISQICTYFQMGVIDPTTQSAGLPSQYKNTLKDLINYSRNYFKPIGGFNTIIPTKLSITLDGISGMVIGNLFTISDNALPKGYKGGDGVGRQLGYIVTNISQEVNTGGWETTLNSQTIIIEAPSEGEEFQFEKIQLFFEDPPASGATSETSYSDKPTVDFQQTYIPKTQLATYLKSKIKEGLNKNVAIAVMAKSINEQGSGDQLKGFNNNFYGVQTDSGRWASKYDSSIVGNVYATENATGKKRAFAAFSTPEVGADFVIGNVQSRGIYVGGTTTYITKGTKVTDATSWAKTYYKEWVRGDANAELDSSELKRLISIYTEATKLIG